MLIPLLAALAARGFSYECGISNPMEPAPADGHAPLGKWPWQVYMWTPESFCGGSIIAERWILTAAHCFEAQFKNQTFDRDPEVTVGVVNQTDVENDENVKRDSTYTVKTVYNHAEFDPVTLKNDIALLELSRPISYSPTVAPVCLAHPDQDVNIDQYSWITGFGNHIDDATGELVREISNVLREAQIPLALHTDCKERWSGVDKFICAGSEGVGAGEGDSGGPLVTQSVDGPFYQVGVVSFGEDDDKIAANHTIGGYTSVGHYCDWIERMTRGEAKCAEKTVEMRLLPEEERVKEKEKEKEESDEVEEGGNDDETTTKDEDDDDSDEESSTTKDDDDGDDEDERDSEGDNDASDSDENKTTEEHKWSLIEILARNHH